MSRAYSDLAFTPAVRAMQTRMGSRSNYAPLDHTDDRRDALGPMEAAFIEDRDSFYQATVSETGWPYVQYRGGPVGFLKVLDEKTLGYADFRGNVQYISVGNLTNNDRISIILMDYANRRRLKILGRVRIIDAADDATLIARLESPHYRARIERAVVIDVEGYDWNCPQHITPRFTELEINAANAPLRTEIARLRSELTSNARPPEAMTTTNVPPTDSLGEGALPLQIVGIRQLTPRVRAYTLRAGDGAPLPLMSAGAHIDVPVRVLSNSRPQTIINGTRRYSIFAVSSTGDEIEIAVQRDYTGSGGSIAAHRDFQLGVTLHCGLPGNDFRLHVGDEPTVLVAGGIGITPIYAMALALQSSGRQITLHYAARSASAAPLLAALSDALGDAMTFYPSEHYTRIDADNVVATAADNAHFYVCGPASLIDAMRAAAERAGIPSARIHVEQFSATALHKTSDRAVRVTLGRSGRVVDVGATESILDAVHAAGIDAPASCRIGNCGTCAVKVLDGAPDHRDRSLSSAEREHASLMCICVSRAHSPTLMLDI